MRTDAELASSREIEGGHPLRFFRWFAAVLPRRGWVIGLSMLFGVCGALVYGALPRDLFPDLTLPTLQLLIQSPGRSATEIELSVAQRTVLVLDDGQALVGPHGRCEQRGQADGDQGRRQEL